MKNKKQLVFLERVNPETDADEALLRLVQVLQKIGITISDDEELDDAEENQD